jgi:hypothetical protein
VDTLCSPTTVAWRGGLRHRLSCGAQTAPVADAPQDGGEQEQPGSANHHDRVRLEALRDQQRGHVRHEGLHRGRGARFTRCVGRDRKRCVHGVVDLAVGDLPAALELLQPRACAFSRS